MYEETALDDIGEGELTVIPRLDIKEATVDLIRYPVSEVEISAGQYGGLKALGRIENTGTEDSSGLVYVAVVLKDSSGVPIGHMFTILTDALKAGEKIGFEVSSFALPDDITVENAASFEVFAYPLQMQF